MARTDGGGTRRRSPAAALEAGREHISGQAGDKGAAASGEEQTDQALAGDQAGDKAGEFARQAFQLDEMQRTALADARETDGGGAAGKTEEVAFWRAAGDRMGFNPITVEEAPDFEETGAFTAYPVDAPEPEFSPATNHEDHAAALDRFEDIAERAEMFLPSLGGDLRDIMLDIFRNRHKPWGALSTDEQKDVATAIDYAVKATLRRAVTLIASDGRPSITAQLVAHTNKGGGEIDGKIKIVGADDSAILALAHATSKTITIVLADAEPYLGQRQDPPFLPEQPELGFDAGDDRAAGDRDLAAEEEEEEEREAGDNGVRGDESSAEAPQPVETA